MVANNFRKKYLFESKYVHQLFEYYADLQPNSPAVSYNGTIITYSELNKRANQLANYLIACGIGSDNLIGIMLDKSCEMIITILAVLKLGSAYVPIPVENRTEHLTSILKSNRISTILTVTHLLNKSNFGKINYLDINTTCITNFSQEFFTNNKLFNKKSLAYVIFTSGSTGAPKGVMVTHSNLISIYKSWEIIYQLTSDDCHLQMANFSFDVFAGDFFRALCSGAKLVLCPSKLLLQPMSLYRLMIQEKITCAEFVPTTLRRLMDYVDANNYTLSHMRLLICGSDNWSVSEYRRLKKLCGSSTRVINSYGLTEATIDSTYFEDKNCINDLLDTQMVPIGIPFSNTEIFILDENMLEVPAGESGELYIGGEGVSAGYLEQDKLTHNKFITAFGKRLFKTGDVGYFLPDGNIALNGRTDNRIKIKGKIIELNYVENVLNSHANIKESMVLVRHNENLDNYLIAVIVLKNAGLVLSKDLVDFLKKRLSSYMIPVLFIKLNNLPLLSNGKLDRKSVIKAINQSKRDNELLTGNEVEAKFKAILENLLGINIMDNKNYLFDIGNDSLFVARLVCEIEKKFSINISVCEIVKFSLLSDMILYIRGKINSLNNSRLEIVAS